MVDSPNYLGDMISRCDVLGKAIRELRLAEESFSTPDAIAKLAATVQERCSHLEQACNKWQVFRNIPPAPLKI